VSRKIPTTIIVKTLTWWVWLLLCYRVQLVTTLFYILLLLNMMTLCSWINPMAHMLLRRTSAQHLHHCIFLVTQHGADHFSNIYSFLFNNMIASWCLSWMNPSPSSFEAACYPLIPLYISMLSVVKQNIYFKQVYQTFCCILSWHSHHCRKNKATCLILQISGAY
jgi:hypothetical protein